MGTSIDFDAIDEDAPIFQPEKTIATPNNKPIRDIHNSPILRRNHELKLLAQHSSNSVEHYTPEPYVEAARELMGEIDFDPCSSWLANQVVKATKWYGFDGRQLVDGLSQPWEGRTLLNPPGGRTSKHAPHLTGLHKTYACIWWGKLVHEWQQGAIQQAVFVGFSLELIQRCQLYQTANTRNPVTFPICYPKERIAYDYPQDTYDGFPCEGTERVKGNNPTHASFICWLPPSINKDQQRAQFAPLFAPFGEVVIP